MLPPRHLPSARRLRQQQQLLQEALPGGTMPTVLAGQGVIGRAIEGDLWQWVQQGWLVYPQEALRVHAIVLGRSGIGKSETLRRIAFIAAACYHMKVIWMTIDNAGNVVHHTTITYSWLTDGPIYGSGLYRDYVRVYVPPQSVLQVQQGWQPRGASTAFGREVWAGFFTLTYGQVETITLTWTEKGGAKKDANGFHYSDLIQHQAGTRWQVNVQIILPSCTASGGLVAQGKQKATFSQVLTQDTNLGIGYSC